MWQSHDTAFARARESGVEATVVSKRMFEGTGLTEASQRGAIYVGADTVGERISGAVRAATESRSITYLYEGELDATGHRRGCGSWAWKHQLAMIDSFAARLREALPERTGLIVTGDHGMVDVDENHRIDVDEEPELMRRGQPVRRRGPLPTPVLRQRRRRRRRRRAGAERLGDDGDRAHPRPRRSTRAGSARWRPRSGRASAT